MTYATYKIWHMPCSRFSFTRVFVVYTTYKIFVDYTTYKIWHMPCSRFNDTKSFVEYNTNKIWFVDYTTYKINEIPFLLLVSNAMILIFRK